MGRLSCVCRGTREGAGGIVLFFRAVGGVVVDTDCGCLLAFG